MEALNITKSVKKAHRAKKSGAKADKKRDHQKKKTGQSTARHNPRAFSVSKIGKTKKNVQRNLDKAQQKEYAPLVDRTEDIPPPVCVVVMGPPGCGKSSLIRSLVKLYTRQNLTEITGPITIVCNKKRRLTLFECTNDLSAMVDLAKIADLVLLMVDASYGFEMETFEFLNILQVHGFPKVMGVLTHLDKMKNNKALSKTKKALKHRFWTEIYQGAKMFYLSGMVNGKYLKNESEQTDKPSVIVQSWHLTISVKQIRNLSLFIQRTKFRPLVWRNSHPYVLVDRYEDLTPPALVQEDPAADRTVCLYGYVRGTHLKPDMRVHLIGAGDFNMREVGALQDPCPLPTTAEGEMKKSLSAKDQLLYAPFSNAGNVLIDQDAVYIDIGQVNYTRAEALDPLSAEAQAARAAEEEEEAGEGEGGAEPGAAAAAGLLRGLQGLRAGGGLDGGLEAAAGLRLFRGGRAYAQAEGAALAGAEEAEEGGGGGSEEEGEAEGGRAAAPGGQQPREKKEVMANGRVRRKAVFADNGQEDEESDSKDESEEEGSEVEEDVENSDEEDQEGVEGEEDRQNEQGSDEDEEESNAKWKQNLAEKAAEAFLDRQNKNVNWASLVYGDDKPKILNANEEEDDKHEEDSGSDGELFFVKKKTLKDGEFDPDSLDTARISLKGISFDDWEEEGDDCPIERLRDKFVTGNWAAGGSDDEGGEEEGGDGSDGDADNPLNDDEVYGDFEDLETGEKFEAKGKSAAGGGGGGAAGSGEEEEEDEEKEEGEEEGEGEGEGEGTADARLRELNALRKAAAQAKKKADREDEEDETAAGKADDELEEEKNEFLELAKKGLADQAARNRAEFAAEGEAQRLRLEGFRQGLYVRIKFEGIPAEFVKTFNPKAPVILGGLLGHEANLALVRARVKKHRWHERVLKTHDPLVVSVGWRRFQSLPMYSIEDQNDRQRFLKYTPEHMHCHATFYAPLIPANTGILAFQTLDKELAGFRICMTGTALELDDSFDVVKKLKLVGTPLKIFKNTAFIQGMFNTELEVAKFEGAAIKTVSGIRGTIKKAASAREGPPGTFRATFEDKILMSDIVFCRTWVPVAPKKFYNPLTNLLEGGTSEEWDKGRMQTVGELRRKLNLPTPVNNDSLYKPIERAPRAFNKLKIPKGVQAALPFASKPKQRDKKANKGYLSKRAVVMEPEERKRTALLQALNTIRNEKVQKRKEANAKRKEEYEKKQAKVDEFFDPYKKQQKRQLYRAKGKEQARKKARA